MDEPNAQALDEREAGDMRRHERKVSSEKKKSPLEKKSLKELMKKKNTPMS